MLKDYAIMQLVLPIYPFLKDNEVEYICKTIKSFYGIR